MSITTTKGTVHSFGLGADGWDTDVDNDLKRFDAWATVFWAFDPITSSALGYHYFGGPVLSGGVPTMIANGSIILADNSVNYVERTAAGVVSRNAIGFTAGRIPMAKVTTAAALITVLEDWRSPDTYLAALSTLPGEWERAVSDETTNLTTGTAKLTFRAPFGMVGAVVRANINTVSSSGLVTIDIKKGGVSIFSTLLTIDVGEKTSVTATTPAVISDTAWTDDTEFTVDITVAGTGAKGLKIAMLGART